jgi:hypothetical protein
LLTTVAAFRHLSSIYAAIYLLSQDSFTTCLALRPEMLAETQWIGDSHAWYVNSQTDLQFGRSLRQRQPGQYRADFCDRSGANTRLRRRRRRLYARECGTFVNAGRDGLGRPHGFQGC